MNRVLGCKTRSGEATTMYLDSRDEARVLAHQKKQKSSTLQPESARSSTSILLVGNIEAKIDFTAQTDEHNDAPH